MKTTISVSGDLSSGSKPFNIIVELTRDEQLANHIPGRYFDLCHKHNVFYRDFKTGELVQLLDLREVKK